MSKEKMIQIPYSLFLKLMRYHCSDYPDESLLPEIKSGIEEKIIRLANRERYEAAMLAKSDPERKRLLDEYYKNKNGCPY